MTPFPKDDEKDHNPEIDRIIQDKLDDLSYCDEQKAKYRKVYDATRLLHLEDEPFIYKEKNTNMKQPIPRVSIQAYCDREVVADKDFVGTGVDYKCVDGYRLTQVNLQAQIFTRKQAEDLIQLLEVAKRHIPPYSPC
jgi:hypothetical protein